MPKAPTINVGGKSSVESTLKACRLRLTVASICSPISSCSSRARSRGVGGVAVEILKLLRQRGQAIGQKVRLRRMAAMDQRAVKSPAQGQEFAMLARQFEPDRTDMLARRIGAHGEHAVFGGIDFSGEMLLTSFGQIDEALDQQHEEVRRLSCRCSGFDAAPHFIDGAW